jgi:hypothetical protein
MRPRSCFVQVWISNDKGEKACYSLRPLPAEELGQSAAGFFLTKITSKDSPVYAVRVEVNGVVSCNCPQYNMTWACKHSDALVASGVLPCNLLSLLRCRTLALDFAEANVQRLETESQRQGNSVTNLLASVSNLTQRCDCLQQMVDEAQDEIVRLDKPKVRRPRKVAA